MEKLTIDEIIDHCERKTEQYERFHKREYLEAMPLASSVMKEYWEHRQVAKYLRKLKDYEDLEEQGRLIKLPCKVGDVVWNYSYFGLRDYKVKYIGFDKDGLLYIDCDGVTYGFRCYLKDFKDKVFLTKSEAEAKLKELRCNNG